MKNIVWQYHNGKTIRKLLVEIGRYRYERALEQMQVSQQPLSMDGFFLEANDDCTFLKYRYPIGVITTIMKIDEFESLPLEGWKRVSVQ